MPEIIKRIGSKVEREKLLKMLVMGRGKEVEDEIWEAFENGAAEFYQELVNEMHGSEAGLAIVGAIRKEQEYRRVKGVEVTVKVKGGQHIKVKSWYGLAKNKKRGRFKKGPNGTGTHILLEYWGYLDKWSPGYLEEVVRSGVASGSYDLAEEELKERGFKISSNSIDYAVQKIGIQVQPHRGELAIEEGESLAGERVVVSLDGGRIRTRELKPGRWEKGQKQTKFDTPWREPKLLVIARLDEKGEKQRKSKSIYEATMNGPEELFKILLNLCTKLELHKAKEIVYIGDGGKWVWNVFEKLTKELPIKDKVTEVLDWCHAVEHLYKMAEDHQGKGEDEQSKWAKQLTPHLKAGKLDLLTHLVHKEKDQIKDFNTHWNYFETHRERMRYDKFKAQRLPIGSGIVESAIKRVINRRIKSTGSYWNLENVENMLPLRCALLSGRWKTYMDNFRQLRTLQLNG